MPSGKLVNVVKTSASADGDNSSSALGRIASDSKFDTSPHGKLITTESARSNVDLDLKLSNSKGGNLLKEDSDTVTDTRTIYSCDDKAERDLIEVTHQREFRGDRSILTSEEANTRLDALKVQGFLDRMNAIFGTARTSSFAMETLLDFCERAGFVDFGQVYALLHSRWKLHPTKALHEIKARWEKDQMIRKDAVDRDLDTVINPDCPPRRLWDLRSNRVVPFWATHLPFRHKSYHPSDLRWLAVSHGWPDVREQQVVDSPINGHQWPITILKDTSLERIRIELLNLAAEREVAYVWLDILCLRFSDPGKHRRFESIRQEEWKLDIPTIGPIFRHAGWTVYYFSGLGRTFKYLDSDVDKYPWHRRALTMQETLPMRIIGGVSSVSPRLPDSNTPSSTETHAGITSLIEVFRMAPSYRRSFKNNIFPVLDEMRKRLYAGADSDVYKIIMLSFFFTDFEPPFPVYKEGEPSEEAWDRLIQATSPWLRAELFFLFPEPGPDYGHTWYPSWQQIKEARTLPSGAVYEDVNVVVDKHQTTYSIACYCLKNCKVVGLSSRSFCRGAVGTLSVADKDEESKFSVTAKYSTPVTDGTCTLVWGRVSNQWVVVRARDRKGQNCFEKVAIIDVLEEGEKRKQMVHMCLSRGKSTLRLV